jgi:hypothetical protein
MYDAANIFIMRDLPSQRVLIHTLTTMFHAWLACIFNNNPCFDNPSPRAPFSRPYPTCIRQQDRAELDRWRLCLEIALLCRKGSSLATGNKRRWPR